MKLKVLKIVIVLLILMTNFMVCIACGGNSSTTLDFQRTHDGDRSRKIMTAVKSDKSDFNIEEITLDFYYGGSVLGAYNPDDDMQLIGVGIYFCNAATLGPYYEKEYHGSDTVDYTKIEGYYFVKFIDIDEYNRSKEYRVKDHFFRRVEFNHKETLTVPSEVIQPDATYRGEAAFCFVVAEIGYKKSTGTYGYGRPTGRLAINYEIKADGTVHLSESDLF